MRPHIVESPTCRKEETGVVCSLSEAEEGGSYVIMQIHSQISPNPSNQSVAGSVRNEDLCQLNSADLKLRCP